MKGEYGIIEQQRAYAQAGGWWVVRVVKTRPLGFFRERVKWIHFLQYNSQDSRDKERAMADAQAIADILQKNQERWS